MVVSASDFWVCQSWNLRLISLEKGWRVDSVVWRTGCFSRGPEFKSQPHHHDELCRHEPSCVGLSRVSTCSDFGLGSSYCCQFAPDQFRALYLKFLLNTTPAHVLIVFQLKPINVTVSFPENFARRDWRLRVQSGVHPAGISRLESAVIRKIWQQHKPWGGWKLNIL